MIQFSVPGQPVAKARPRVTRNGTFTPLATKTWQGKCARQGYLACLDARVGKTIAPLSIRVMAFFSIPKSWSNKKRLQAIAGDIQHTTKPDLDNLLKIVCDALNGIIYDDDKQIVAASVSKHYSETPRVEIVVDRWHQRMAA